MTASTETSLKSAIEAQRRTLAENASAVAYSDLGNLLAEAGDVEAAEEAYRQAIAQDPNLVAAHYNLALLYEEMGRENKAIAQLEEVLEIDPKHPRANFQLGKLYEGKGRRNKAIEHYALAFAEAPSLSFARNNPQILDSKLATEALLETGNYLEAERTRARRQYGDRQRIASLLAGQNSATPSATAEAAETKGDSKGSNASFSSSGGEGSASSSGSRVITNEDIPQGGSGAKTPTRPGAAKTGRGAAYYPNPQPSTAPGQPVNAAKVEGLNPNQYKTDPATGQPVFIQPSVPTVDPSQKPGVTDPGQPERFKPTRRSTASLEWNLEEVNEGQG